jgi:hypothetical protein
MKVTSNNMYTFYYYVMVVKRNSKQTVLRYQKALNMSLMIHELR